MRKLYIVGSGGFGKEALWLAKRINSDAATWDLVGFIDDDPSLHNKIQCGYPVVGGCDYLGALSEEVWVAVAIGTAKVKKAVVEKLMQYRNVHFATLIDPSVIRADRVCVEEGCIICAGTVLAVDSVIGKHTIINLSCTVGHDAVLEDYVTVYPGVNISGNVIVSEAVELGTGMQVIQGKKIGRQSIVGAGSVVVKDIPERCTAVGSPAKPIKFFD
ncbi:acetyltransferase [Ruminococcus gauvreauii]|uniref:acetyltransferase n=1 Tax=Ruminococcus gauvreauii TaxID=438033 RepID=UPI0039840E3F